MMVSVDEIAKKVLLKAIFLLTGALLMALMPGPQDPVVQAAGQHSEIKVNFRDGTLSVHIRNLPLKDILQTIGDQVGFKLKVIGCRESRITQNFTNIPLTEGI
jgi:hypothetical protein